jgi:hypothetical protein
LSGGEVEEEEGEEASAEAEEEAVESSSTLTLLDERVYALELIDDAATSAVDLSSCVNGVGE